MATGEARELAKVETELACTTDEWKEEASRLERIEQDYRVSRQKRTETLQDIWFKMRRFFRQKRGDDPDVPDHHGPESEGIVLPEMLPEVSSGFNGTTPQVEPTNGTAVVAERPEEEEEEEDDDCIIVGGDPFQKCGNYEWNRQGCHGSSGDTIDIPASRERGQRKKQLEDGAQETSPQYPELPSERQADRETERQPERQYERHLDQRPERPAEPEPAPQTECQAGWTTAQQPKRGPEHQPEKVPNRPDERFHDAIFAEAPERTAEVATIQIAERPHEMSHGSASRSSTGPPSRSATALRLNYAPERMIDPVDSPLPTPIYPRTGLSETSHSMLPSGVLRHPHADFMQRSHINVTQYWTWVSQIQCFQHQVLKDIKNTREVFERSAKNLDPHHIARFKAVREKFDPNGIFRSVVGEAIGVY
ncbi:hypothetical protein FPRO04_13462 [Fusarium proliferatum]|nr:hypothetical protein FPRO04_13462 [Fusarium proliferatum]